MVSSRHYDLAVVGGGIAGLYCCLNAPKGTRVALFEATDRFGGKVETCLTGGFTAEFGSMRLDPARQPIIGGLISSLGLQTFPFPEYSAPPADARKVMYSLRGDEKGKNSLELFALGVARVLGKTVPELMNTSDEELDHLRQYGTHRGRPLWELGLWQALAGVLSYDAVDYIMTHGSFFHGVHENPGLWGTMIIWVKMLRMSPDLKGVKGGVQQITDGMLESVRGRGVQVQPGRCLRALAPGGADRVRLFFFDGLEVTARHVVLAIPSSSLKSLGGLPAEIRPLLNSVIAYPLLKCFFVIKDPWWDKDVPNAGVMNLPARELHYQRAEDSGIMMVYADRPYRNYWKGYVRGATHARAELDFKPGLASVFAERMGVSADRVIATGIRDWVRSPYGAGVHLWKAGVRPWEVSERLEAFSLDGGPRANVHICGEAFSDYQGFMEGALRSANSVLARVSQ